MYVRDFMNEDSVVCTEDTPLENVYQLMMGNNLEYVTVVESRAHRIPIGIITEHEICQQIVVKGRSPRGLTAANVMNTHIAKISYAASLADCSDLMQETPAKLVFVTDEDGMLCGTLSRSDVEQKKTQQPVETLFGGAVAQQYQTPGVNRLY